MASVVPETFEPFSYAPSVERKSSSRILPVVHDERFSSFLILIVMPSVLAL